MRKIKVTGILYVEPEDVDDSPSNKSGVPLTEEAFETYVADLGLDDVEFELLDDDD